MEFSSAKIKSMYEMNNSLKKEDVEALINWTWKQPHLPKINEFLAIVFLHSCYYSNEEAKRAIENFFTFRTNTDLFKNKPLSSMHETLNTMIATVLPQKTPEDHSIIFFKIIDSDVNKFDFDSLLKYIDDSVMLDLYLRGISNGHVVFVDFEGWTFGHLAKINLFSMKKFLFYLQEAWPTRLKGLHFYNCTSVLDKLLYLAKPFMKKELLSILHIHLTMESLNRYIPLNCLPEDYSGSIESLAVLKEKQKQEFLDNDDFFEWENSFATDESKRLKKLNSEIYIPDGTFKNLDID